MTDASTSTNPVVNQTPGKRPRVLLVLGLIGLALFVVFGIAVFQNVEAPFTQPMDDAWRALVGASSIDHVTWAVPMFFQYLGELPGFTLALLLVPIWLFIVRRWRSALFWITAQLVGNFGVSQLTKNLVDRPRPADDLVNGLYGPLFSVDHGSFPSGHAVTAGILLIAVAAVLPPAKRRIWWFIAPFLALGMIWQRTLINAHWFSDAVFGIIGGVSMTLVIWWLFSTLIAKDYGKPLFRRARAATAPAEPALPAAAA
ncbi:undecaprenyl-diphosphatase [Agromyces sp. CF514]|uniref:phosphatase PAP2 family protein n=1 Tax=Agromyces sp. CF514 TaxID=1881031 RepID=UPI0008DF10A2|nr:phosphatase PAP2 family protein [Agromyces sp. CF514]SFR68480.1 undecaprenyl-diphosphatase [Agromyces sp. CF514]